MGSRVHRSQRRPCEDCGKPTFVCLLCGMRYHEDPLPMAPIRTHATDRTPVNDDYVSCERCAPAVRRAVEPSN